MRRLDSFLSVRGLFFLVWFFDFCPLYVHAIMHSYAIVSLGWMHNLQSH